MPGPPPMPPAAAPPPAATPPGGMPMPGRGEPDSSMTQQIPNMRGGSGGYEVPGRHGKMDMTSEIRASDSPFTPDDAHRLDQLRRTFQLRRFGSGYDRTQVDRLFDAIGATMVGRSAVTVTDGELDPGQFSLVQGGYFEAEVDSALREVRDLFARRGVRG
ncbi:MAG: DivIVA domain-containing protein, partial [Micromonosporaceae bacterium]